MPEITITLSDGTPHKAELDSDGWLPLPRGKKPAEPWWSKCAAVYGETYAEPNYSVTPLAAHEFRCETWGWPTIGWHRIRPIPPHTWDSIAAEAKPARDYSQWQEGMGAEAKPEDYSPEKYEVEYRHTPHDQWSEVDGQATWGPRCAYRVRRRPSQPAVGIGSPPPESDEAFLWRVFVPCIDRVEFYRDDCIAVTDAGHRFRVKREDGIRITHMIGVS